MTGWGMIEYVGSRGGEPLARVYLGESWRSMSERQRRWWFRKRCGEIVADRDDDEELRLKDLW